MNKLFKIENYWRNIDKHILLESKPSESHGTHLGSI